MTGNGHFAKGERGERTRGGWCYSEFDAVNDPLPRHLKVPKRNHDSLITGDILAFSECLLLTEAVEKLFWGLPDDRLIRDTALKGKNDSLRSRI